MYDRCARCSAILNNLLDYSPKDGISFDSVNIKCAKSELLSAY